MTRNLHTTVDLSSARFKHLNWKFRIRSFLDGKETLTLQQAVSHTECDLSRWYYAEGKAKYGHLPVMQKFEEEHIKLHATIKRVVELKNNNQTLEAETLYKEISLLSDAIIQLLDEAEKKINRH